MSTWGMASSTTTRAGAPGAAGTPSTRFHPGNARQRWWTAIQGATRGAWFGWQVFAVAGAPTPTLAVLTMYPRLETMGSIPRRFVEAEPLLEHGMSLALVFVDAVSATRSGAR